MPTPEVHALLSASSAERWMNCTRAPRLEETLPEKTSDYAEEGRLAHAIAELKVRKKFTVMKSSTFNYQMKKLKENPLYQDEMQEHTDTYLEYLMTKAMSYKCTPYIAVEVRLDFSHIVPEGFGTGDCVMIGGDTLQITDFKYGKGVPVSVENNPQFQLYALGALKTYAPIYGDSIKHIRTAVVQPRLDSISEQEITVEKLLSWGENVVKPIAEIAFKGEGEFKPGHWCRFCRAKVTCRARSENNTALEDFKGALPPILSDMEVGTVLEKAQHLKAWVSDLEEYALKALLEGKLIPGWKVVEGRSNRQFTDTDKALETAIAAGYPKANLYKYVPETLTNVERLLGKKEFADVLGSYIIKPPGKPTLAIESDKRSAYSPHDAASDFKGIGEIAE